LVPCVEPKFAPAIVTDAPTGPEFGVSVVMLGAATTVNAFPALDAPETVTTTLPVVAPVGTMATMLVALHVLTVAAVPLNLTVLVPFVEPNPVPVMVMEAPIAPDAGERLEIVGAAAARAGSARIEVTRTNAASERTETDSMRPFSCSSSGSKTPHRAR